MNISTLNQILWMWVFSVKPWCVSLFVCDVMNLSLSPALVVNKKTVRNQAQWKRMCTCVCVCICDYVCPVVLRWSVTNISNYRACFQYNKGLIAPGNKLNTCTLADTRAHTFTYTHTVSVRQRQESPLSTLRSYYGNWIWEDLPWIFKH